MRNTASSLDIRALRIFLAAAAAGNLSDAAKQLGITQSAVSQTLGQIEAILGMQVADRSYRPMKLTAAGLALSRRARLLVEDMDGLLAHVRDVDLASYPAIRVGLIDSFAATYGALLVKHITASTSQLLLWSGLNNNNAQALLRRQLDIIIVPDPLEDEDKLIRRQLLTEPFVIVIPKIRLHELQHLDLHGLIERAPLIRFSLRSHFGAVVERYLRRRGHSPRAYLEIDTADVVMAMVAANLGWTITTPLCLLQGRFYAANLAVLPITGPAFSRTIYQVSRTGEYEDMANTCFHMIRRILENQLFSDLRLFPAWVVQGITLH